MNGKPVQETEIQKHKHYAAECLFSTLTTKLHFLTEGARQNASSGLTVALQILFMFHEWLFDRRRRRTCSMLQSINK